MGFYFKFMQAKAETVRPGCCASRPQGMIHLENRTDIRHARLCVQGSGLLRLELLYPGVRLVGRMALLQECFRIERKPPIPHLSYPAPKALTQKNESQDQCLNPRQLPPSHQCGKYRLRLTLNPESPIPLN